ncbi:MAG: hypothetical protein AMXMBFR56_65870 [Polyangiaceae bacterium]
MIRVWQTAWKLAKEHGAPVFVVDYLRARYTLAVARKAVAHAAAEVREELRAGRVAFVPGATTPPSEGPWACLSGDGPACDPGSDADMIADLHDDETWRAPPARGGRWLA